MREAAEGLGRRRGISRMAELRAEMRAPTSRRDLAMARRRTVAVRIDLAWP